MFINVFEESFKDKYLYRGSISLFNTGVDLAEFSIS